MVSQGKLVLAAVAGLVALCCLAVGTQADGHQPCRHLKLKTGDATEAQCQACCAESQLEKATSYDMCRCRTVRAPRTRRHAPEEDHDEHDEHDHHDCPCKGTDAACPCRRAHKHAAHEDCPCKSRSGAKCAHCAANDCPCKGL